ncbi:MAG: Sir2 family NAD-dependent protein deacetylase [Candidatus Omnitrophota bacterium]
MQDIVDTIKQGNVVAFCGAGLSKDSGIPTFRDKGGLWDRYNPSVYATLEGLTSLLLYQPASLKKFLVEAYTLILNAKPNQAHYGLKYLEKQGYVTCIITQNIDDLHWQAGSESITEIHGNIYRFACLKCDYSVKKSKSEVISFLQKLKIKERSREIIAAVLEFTGKCKSCKKRLSSDVVLFGQLLPESQIQRSYSYLHRATCVLCIGTSLTVYPAATLPLYARERGAKIINVNCGESSLEAVADINIYQEAGCFFNNLLKQI